MKKLLNSAAVAAALILGMLPFSGANVRAQETITVDCSDIRADPSCQYYFSDENEFFRDGIKVMSGKNDVTDLSEIVFNTTPATIYNGSDNDYTVSFTAKYEDVSCVGQMNVKIGLRGDADNDGRLTEGDYTLILSELAQSFGSGRSMIKGSDSFRVFLANADGGQHGQPAGTYGRFDLNAADAFFVSSHLNSKGSKGLYDNIVQKNGLKPQSGSISITSAAGRAGDTVQLYISESCSKMLGAFDFTVDLGDSGLKVQNVYSMRNSFFVNSIVKGNTVRIFGIGKSNAVADGRIAVMRLVIPENAETGSSFAVKLGRIDYFGAASDISDSVSTSDGSVSVREESSLCGVTGDDLKGDAPSYDGGVKVWDTAVDAGTKKVSLPVMLLGGSETKGLKLTLSCAAPLSIKTLANAEVVSGSSSEGLVGIYERSEALKADFETLEVDIDENAASGVYPVKINIESIEGAKEGEKIVALGGSVTVRDKSYVYGDANEDGTVNVRDAALIAKSLASGRKNALPPISDHNKDDRVNIRDAASVAKALASK